MNKQDITKRSVKIVGIGGTLRDGSSSEKALKFTLEAARHLGAETFAFTGANLRLPLFEPEMDERVDDARRLISLLGEADGIIIASPSYHGAISGAIKNALDYVEDMNVGASPYFDGRAVGCIASAAGWQGANLALQSLRSITHALRGWPTPLGVAFNSKTVKITSKTECSDPGLADQLTALATQVVLFSQLQRVRNRFVVAT